MKLRTFKDKHLDALDQAAVLAGGGDWQVVGERVTRLDVIGDYDGLVCRAEGRIARHIAANGPVVTMSLTAEIRRLRKRVALLEKRVDK